MILVTRCSIPVIQYWCYVLALNKKIYDEYSEGPVTDYYYGQCAEWSIGNYWTSEGDSFYAWAMNSTYETLDAYNIDFGGYWQYGIGIRPVITVSISDLS